MRKSDPVVPSEFCVIYETPGSIDPTVPRPRSLALDHNGPSVGKFGKYEVEEAAGKLLSFIQSRGNCWLSFTILELVEYYQTQGWDPNIMFFGLCGAWYDDSMSTLDYRKSRCCLALDPNGQYHVTSLFIETCGGRVG